LRGDEDLALVEIARREVRRFFKYKWWTTGIILMNLSDMVILGLIYNGIVNAKYTPYYFKFLAPGITAMAAFISAFSIGRETALEIITGYNDYLRSLPIGDFTLAFGKIIAGSLRGIIYSFPFLTLTFIIVSEFNFMKILEALITIFIITLAMSSLGIAIAPLVKKLSIYTALRSLLYYVIYFFGTIYYPKNAIMEVARNNKVYFIVYLIGEVNPVSKGAEIIRSILNISTINLWDIVSFLISSLTTILIGSLVYVEEIRSK